MVAAKGTKSLSFKRQAFYTGLIVVVLFACAEFGLRVWVFFLRTDYERYNFSTGRLELVPNTREKRTNGEDFVINSRGFVGPEFTEVPAESKYRIIAVGDSCTFSDGVWSHSYPGMLDRLLNETSRTRKFEVINGGIEGYSSIFALNRIKEEIVKYHPRLVILYIGWNDLMKTDPQNASATGKYTLVSEILHQSYFVKAYAKIMFQYLRPLLFQPKLSVDAKEESAFDNFLPRTFELNLREAILELRSRGTAVILMTLPTAVHSRMTREEIAERHIFFPYFAGTYSVGKFLSLHRAYNRSIRKIGEDLAVSVVDLDAKFESYGERKVGLFWDTMHPSREGHEVIAKYLAVSVRKEAERVR